MTIETTYPSIEARLRQWTDDHREAIARIKELEAELAEARGEEINCKAHMMELQWVKNELAKTLVPTPKQVGFVG